MCVLMHDTRPTLKALCMEANFAISCILISLPTTSWWVAHIVGEIKFSEIFVTIQSEPLVKFLASENFVVCSMSYALLL